MKRIHENIKEFGNGNINLRFTPEQIEEVKTGKISDVEVISWILDEIDCYFIGEQYCLSNYCMGATIYNAYSDLCYTINFSDVEDVLMTGRHIKLYARKPDEDDREIIEEEWGGNSMTINGLVNKWGEIYCC